MGTTTTESPTVTVRLTRDAAAVLLREARERFENGACELFGSNDESQRPTIAACTEIIGRIGELVDRPWRWPQRETSVGMEEQPLADFDFSPATLAWFECHRDQQRGYVEDFDTGVNGGADPGYHAEQVFLLHVLDGIVASTGRVD